MTTVIDHDTQQPVDDIQLSQLRIEWVDRSSIHPNKYNPNKMTWHERTLLRTSLLEDGWTQPIVTLPDHTIVDGEQRWTTSGIPLHPEEIQEIIDKMIKRGEQGAVVSESILNRLRRSKERLQDAIDRGLPPCIASITGGLVPITVIDLGDDAHKMISTIRHNRARGSHSIDRMTAITNDLVQMGLDFDDLEKRLGMEDEEIRRFTNAAKGQLADMEAALAGGSYSPAWKPEHISALGEAEQKAFAKSAAAAQAIKERNIQATQRSQQVQAAVEQKAAELAAQRGAAVDVIERAQIAAEVEKAIPVPPPPEKVKLEKIVLFVLPEEAALIRSVLGEEMAAGLVRLCQAQAAAQRGAV